MRVILAVVASLVMVIFGLAGSGGDFHSFSVLPLRSAAALKSGRRSGLRTASQLSDASFQNVAAGAVAATLVAVVAGGARLAGGVSSPGAALRQATSRRWRGSSLVARRAEPMMPWRIPNTQRWQWLSVRELLLRERIVMITEYIDENYANANLAMLLYLQNEDATKPVQIYFASPGAQLKPALALYDTIGQLKARGCKVTTVCHSLCAGMSAFLAASGSPGRRFATPNALFRLTQTGLEMTVQGQAADIEVETLQMLRETARVEEEFAKMTGQPLEKIQKDLKRAFYLSAAGAAEYGLVDRVLVPQSDKGAKLDQGSRDPWSGVVTREKVGFGVFADPNQPRTAV